MNNIIVGTSGHIDHGKTTLIKALTGRETDKLSEEKKRGISIELGFTYFDLPNKNRVGIIDVPGHEKFIRNMLAGAGGIDLFLLVIAADEGIMPQTIEHANILSYLNIKDGIIVLTKADTVEDDFLELVKEDIREQFSGTFLEGKEIIPVDSVSRRGIDELIDKIQETSENMEEKKLNAPPRLNVDRVFSLKGFGTVLTGTLLDGKLSVDDDMIIYPSETPAKMRSIQVHGENVDTAYAGQRTAINISNLSTDEIQRGDVLAAPHSVEKAMMIDVRISLVKNTDWTITHWDRLRLYHGSNEILCRAVPLDTKEIKAGESALVQLRLEDEIVCRKGDHFVLMSYSPMETIGGGTIIDTSTKKNKAFDMETIETLKIKEEGKTEDIILEYLRQSEDFYNGIEKLMSYTGDSKENIQEALMDLVNSKDVLDINNFYVSTEFFEKLKLDILKKLEEKHKTEPLSPGYIKEELRSQVCPSIKNKEFTLILDLLEKDELLNTYEGFIHLKDFTIKLNKEEEKIKNKLFNAIQKADFASIPSIDSLVGEDNLKNDILFYMINIEKTVKLLGKEAVISMKQYNEARELLMDYFKENDEISLAEFRDLAQSSRKNSLLILEEFDKDRLTQRKGENRTLLKRT